MVNSNDERTPLEPDNDNSERVIFAWEEPLLRNFLRQAPQLARAFGLFTVFGMFSIFVLSIGIAYSSNLSSDLWTVILRALGLSTVIPGIGLLLGICVYVAGYWLPRPIIEFQENMIYLHREFTLPYRDIVRAEIVHNRKSRDLQLELANAKRIVIGINRTVQEEELRRIIRERITKSIKESA